jgi:drug/metabolite transporter (DMT)-like permease
MNFALMWVPVTLIAAAAQTGRNATQRSLTSQIGTTGATHVRFLYGLPFALIAIALVRVVTGEPIPSPDRVYLFYVVLGALVQILATGLMLSAMTQGSFAVVTAYTKTEPVQVAVFGLVLLGDQLTGMVTLAILIATCGLLLTSIKRSSGLVGHGYRPVLLGVASGACFALASVFFRGAILSLPDGSYLMRATTTLAWGLSIQAGALVLWLGLFNRKVLMETLRVWRTSLGAGFLGAFASQFWFLGFALTSAANVRTLALVEVLMAQAVAQWFMGQRTSPRELAGMALIVCGVALLLLAQS